jgi:hypothetical protein
LKVIRSAHKAQTLANNRCHTNYPKWKLGRSTVKYNQNNTDASHRKAKSINMESSRKEQIAQRADTCTTNAKTISKYEK